VVSMTDPYGRIFGFLDQSRYFFFQVAPQLYSRGVDPVIILIVVILVECHCYQLLTKCYPVSSSHGKSMHRRSYIRINYWSDVLHLSDKERKCEYNETLQQLFIDLKEALSMIQLGGRYCTILLEYPWN
jgi:hypothetical protein